MEEIEQNKRALLAAMSEMVSLLEKAIVLFPNTASLGMAAPQISAFETFRDSVTIRIERLAHAHTLEDRCHAFRERFQLGGLADRP